MRKKLRFAIVGAGGIAGAHAKAFLHSASAELVAVIDTRADVGAHFGESASCPSFTSPAAMLETCSVDAVLICAPPVFHSAIAIDFIHHGIHVLCEKPFSVDVASAKLMLQAAEIAGVRLTMASKFRYTADLAKAKALIDGGLIGEVLSVENAFTSRVAMAARWNSDPRISGGGVIIDNGTHSVDIVRYLCGPITTICATEGIRVQKLPVEDTAHIVAQTAGGIMASIDASWSINKENDSYVQICGAEGTLNIGWGQSRYRAGDSKDWVTFGNGYDKVAALAAQLDNFCGAIRGEELLRITGADALASVETVTAAYISLAQRRWVPVDSFLRAPLPVETLVEIPAIAAAPPIVHAPTAIAG